MGSIGSNPIVKEPLKPVPDLRRRHHPTQCSRVEPLTRSGYYTRESLLLYGRDYIQLRDLVKHFDRNSHRKFFHAHRVHVTSSVFFSAPRSISIPTGASPREPCARIHRSAIGRCPESGFPRNDTIRSLSCTPAFPSAPSGETNDTFTPPFSPNETSSPRIPSGRPPSGVSGLIRSACSRSPVSFRIRNDDR